MRVSLLSQRGSATPPKRTGHTRRAACLRAVPALLLLVLFAALCSSCGGGGERAITGWPNANGDVVVDYNAGVSAMQRLNHYRIGAGLLPVALSYSQSVGCQLHANYLADNHLDLHEEGLSAHGESPQHSGYSSAGDAAGRASVIYQGVGPEEAIEGWMQTFYHRLGMLDPNLTSVGFGSNGGYQVMDITRGRVFGFDAVPAMGRFPAPGMSDAPPAYRVEIPHPIEGDESLGVPITVEFFGSRGYSINSIRASLEDSLSGDEVPIYLQYPGLAFLEDWDLAQVICVIPRDPLESGRSYTVTITGYVDGEAWDSEWSFRTR